MNCIRAVRGRSSTIGTGNDVRQKDRCASGKGRKRNRIAGPEDFSGREMQTEHAVGKTACTISA